LPCIHDQHLETVLDVGKTRIRIVIEREDLNVGILLLQPFHYTATADMVGETTEGLENDKRLYPF
jgi:hypothetical protein